MFPELITDRTLEDVQQQTDKGHYNASDLNRVTEAMDYLYDTFTSRGYSIPAYKKMMHTWTIADIPTIAQMRHYLSNLQALRDVLAQQVFTPSVPATMERLKYTTANDIEKILVDIEYLLRMSYEWLYYCGELYSGEVLE